ncbi:CopG family transcriptional regulator [Corynebacterium pseudotuberculosis]|uniref:CopG family transcriptional regulator n=1 Tax=Corynebacterium pseudotuberculosis TaxID=1719 RepID=UPI0020C84220|nr:CopG family transcriptional regulator [Corynebacterium pseudotuberculosis]UTO24495.1 CopG family transcriptional regulator [Corynebacterium pseudotuberculosis]
MAMTLRLTPEQDRALTLLAEIQGSSKHEAAVRAIINTAVRALADSEIRELARSHLPAFTATERRIRGNRP